MQKIDDLLPDLLVKGAIRTCQPCANQFISPMFYLQSVLGAENSKLKQQLEESTELISRMISED